MSRLPELIGAGLSMLEPVTAGRLLLRSPAKINLYLEVQGRRHSGYHDIASVMVPVSLCDEIEIEQTDNGIETRVLFGEEGDVDPCGLLRATEYNLATRAANALKERTGYEGGVRITLKKRIPVGGGLGGGSADAAAVLIGLNRLWGAGLSADDLMEIGTSLGCDVPGMIAGGPVLVTGLGEGVRRISCARGVRDSWWLVIVNPGFPVSTKDIYSRCSPPLTCKEIPVTTMVSAMQEDDLERVSASLFNGLQDTVFRKYPLIHMLAQELAGHGALGVLLSGSGASIFGLARDQRHASDLQETVAARLTGPAWCVAVCLLPDGVTVAHGPLEA